MSVLYVVATPIGNLGDVSRRAEETLRSVSVILCEDTRVTSKMLARLEIKKELMVLHQHTERSRMRPIIDRLIAGEDMALVTDAGTPGISDPGGIFVEELLRTAPDVQIMPIPGPNAVATALSVAGVAADNYLFLGFPPHKKGRQTFFDRIIATPFTVVFFESTHRIEKALSQIAERDTTRKLIVCRELTKMHETIYRGTATEVLEQLSKTSIKGEFVVILAPQK